LFSGEEVVDFDIDDITDGSYVYLDLPEADKGSKLKYYGGYIQVWVILF